VDHPKDVGDRSTLAVMLGLQQRGYALLLPFGENTRYDLVIEDAPFFARVQCKTGRLRNAADYEIARLVVPPNPAVAAA
jgi:hypothetical protein